MDLVTRMPRFNSFKTFMLYPTLRLNRALSCKFYLSYKLTLPYKKITLRFLKIHSFYSLIFVTPVKSCEMATISKKLGSKLLLIFNISQK